MRRRPKMRNKTTITMAVCLVASIFFSQVNEVRADNISHANQYVGKNERTNRVQLKNLLKVDPARTPWCAAFVNSILKKSGNNGSNDLTARSFLRWGVKVSNPQEGDVVVIRTKSGYHVGFFAGFKGNKVLVLGGNQSNSVKVTAYPRKSVVQFRRG